jgi:hypothetical protein
MELGKAKRALGEIDGAIKCQRQAIKIYERLGNANPSVASYQEDMAKACNNLGAVRWSTDFFAEASQPQIRYQI